MKQSTIELSNNFLNLAKLTSRKTIETIMNY